MKRSEIYDIQFRAKDKYEAADFLHAIIPNEDSNIVVKGYLPNTEITGIIFPDGRITSYISA
jgi:hypothetical protein